MGNKYFDTGNIDKINQQLEKIENLINDSNKKISEFEELKQKRKETINKLKKEIKKVDNNKTYLKAKIDKNLKLIIADSFISTIKNEEDFKNFFCKTKNIIEKYGINLEQEKFEVSKFKTNNDELDKFLNNESEEDEEFNL